MAWMKNKRTRLFWSKETLAFSDNVGVETGNSQNPHRIKNTGLSTITDHLWMFEFDILTYSNRCQKYNRDYTFGIMAPSAAAGMDSIPLWMVLPAQSGTIGNCEKLHFKQLSRLYNKIESSLLNFSGCVLYLKCFGIGFPFSKVHFSHRIMVWKMVSLLYLVKVWVISSFNKVVMVRGSLATCNHL